MEDFETAVHALRALNRARSSGSSLDLELQDECELWVVVLTKEKGQRFGFSFTSARIEYQQARTRKNCRENEGPEALMVKEMADSGLAEVWNKQNPGKDILTCDRITEVSGRKTISDMQLALRTLPSVTLHMMRYPQYFLVNLQGLEAGSQQPMGETQTKQLGLTYQRVESSRGHELKITVVSQEGLVEQWNQRQIQLRLWHFVVTAGMCIEAVNDRTGQAEKLENEMLNCNARRLRIRRADIGELARQKVASRFRILQKFRSAGTLKNSSLKSTKS